MCLLRSFGDRHSFGESAPRTRDVLQYVDHVQVEFPPHFAIDFHSGVLLFVANSLPAQFAVPAEADIVIYGGTSAAITAAVQAKQMGKSVVIVSPDKHLGGMSSGGLGCTDTGNKAVIGGLSREFYHRVWQHYQKPERGNGSGRRNSGTRAGHARTR